MTDFGRSLSRHAGTFGAGGWLWYISGLLILAGVFGTIRGALGLVGLMEAVPGYTPISSILTGLAAGFFGVLAAIVPVLRWQQTLEIFEGGVSWTRLTGVKSWPRAQLRSVRHVTHHSRQGTSYEVEVTLADGSIHGVVGVDQSQQAANLIHQIMGGAAPAAPSAQPQATGWRPPGSA